MRMRQLVLASSLAGLVGVLGFAVGGCDREESTKTPGGRGGDPGSRLEQLGKDSEAADGQQALPTVRDRDPEEEKKKMALSRRHSAQARSSLQRGALDSAIEEARQALRVHEQNVDAMLVIAEAFYRQGKHGLAQAVTSSALAVDPKIRSPQETSRAHNLMGFALIALGKDAQATDAFRKAAETDEKNAAAWNNLGTRYLDAGDIDTALSCFTYALELQPSFAKAHVNHGAALRGKRRWQDAEKALMHALRLKKNYAEAYFNLGVLYLDADPFPGLETTKRLNKAIAHLTKYRELAVADGTGGSGSSRPASGAAGHGSASLGPSVSRERADDYIRVAKKGIEREQRRLEREKERQTKGGTPAGGGTQTPQTKDTSKDTSQSDAPQSDKPDASDKPSATSPATGARPEPEAPKKEPEPESPPADAPTESPPAQPPSAPAPQKPTVQKPGGTP
jgi:tetratricopeptide (TPR) repeat protein